MVHILCNERDLDALVDWHNHLWIGGRCAEDLDLLGWVRKLPLPLVTDHLDLDSHVLWLSGINDVQHASGGEEEGDDHDERNDRPDDFKDQVAVGLDGERGVVRLAAVAND